MPKYLITEENHSITKYVVEASSKENINFDDATIFDLQINHEVIAESFKIDEIKDDQIVEITEEYMKDYVLQIIPKLA